MADEYFDDASDADFLALAQQIETREQTNSAGVSRGGTSSGGTAQPRSSVSRPTLTPKPATPSSDAGASRPETSKTSDKTPRVLRPGFNAIIVNTRQKGNPILENIKNVPWEYGDILPDYVLGATTCCLFLSLRYHRLHPEYIYNRIQKLGKEYSLRILLIMDNHSDPLRELTKTSLVNDYTVILAWSPPEAGRYLETFKAFEHANSNSIKQHQATDYSTRLIETLTTIRSVNKNDAVSLVTNFGSLSRALMASPSQIATLGGWGPQKLERFERTVTEPFIIKTGSGGPIGLGKHLKGGRWTVDEDGAQVLEEMETYGNAGRTVPTAATRGPTGDERMPEEWNRARNIEGGEVVGFIGQRPIVRAGMGREEGEIREESERMVGVVGEGGGEEDVSTAGETGVMAALARLRQQE